MLQSIEDYCEYIKRNMDILRVEDGVVMAVIDGIGDRYKRGAIAEMERGNVPVHFGEDPRYPDWYVQRYNYITIGGMVGKFGWYAIYLVDRTWEKHLIDGSEMQRLRCMRYYVRVHRGAIPLVSCDHPRIQELRSGSDYTCQDFWPLQYREKSSRHNFWTAYYIAYPDETDKIYAMLEEQGFNAERSTSQETERHTTFGVMV